MVLPPLVSPPSRGFLPGNPSFPFSDNRQELKFPVTEQFRPGERLHDQPLYWPTSRLDDRNMAFLHLYKSEPIFFQEGLQRLPCEIVEVKTMIELSHGVGDLSPTQAKDHSCKKAHQALLVRSVHENNAVVFKDPTDLLELMGGIGEVFQNIPEGNHVERLSRKVDLFQLTGKHLKSQDLPRIGNRVP